MLSLGDGGDKGFSSDYIGGLRLGNEAKYPNTNLRDESWTEMVI